MKNSKNKTELFILKAKKIHGDKYSYYGVDYIRSNKKVKISCTIHGIFEQTPNAHLGSKGCFKCARKANGALKKFSTESFIEKAKLIHGNKYIYDKVDYKSSLLKVILTCRKHGDFNKLTNNHLQGQGCPKCGKESHWRRSDYIKKAKGRICTFYTIRCFNEEESFYKIGITMNKLSVRYQKGILPYNYVVISETLGEAGFIWDLELLEKRKLKEFNYQPIIPFKGSVTECFTKYKYGSN